MQIGSQSRRDGALSRDLWSRTRLRIRCTRPRWLITQHFDLLYSFLCHARDVHKESFLSGIAHSYTVFFSLKLKHRRLSKSSRLKVDGFDAPGKENVSQVPVSTRAWNPLPFPSRHGRGRGNAAGETGTLRAYSLGW